MNRRVLAGLLALAVSGCAQVRTPMSKLGRDVPSVSGGSSLAPIGETINGGSGLLPPATTAVLGSEEPARSSAAPGVAGDSVSNAAQSGPAARSSSSPAPAEPITPPLVPVVAEPANRDQSAPPAAAPAAGANEGSSATLIEPDRAAASIVAREAPRRAAAADSTARAETGPAPVDAAVRRAGEVASANDTDAKVKVEAEIRSRAEMKSSLNPGKLLGKSVATVGSESISQRDLQMSFNEWRADNVPDGQTIRPEDAGVIAKRLLDELINRLVVIQEAKRTFLKSDKQQKAFYEFADKDFKEKKVPTLLRKHKVKSEYDLDQALREQGRSLKAMREAYRLDVLKTEFIRGRLGARIKPNKPDLEAYYRSHVHDYDRPAQITWREIVIKTGAGPESALARKKADAVRARLGRGEDFVATAKRLSEGPTAADGGKRVTEPKASASKAVNEALDTLPIGQLSPVLEGPGGFSIVRVEARRAPGPASFVEAQNEVLKACMDEKINYEIDNYIKKLRSQAVIVHCLEQGEAGRGGGGDSPAPPSARTADRGRESPDAPL